MHFANVKLLAAVAFVIDGYMHKNAQAMFDEKCRVAAERNRADMVLYNALPTDIANELKIHGKVVARSHPSMAVLLADIVGFTQFAAVHAPDEVLEALVDALHIEKIKTIGDAYMAVSKTCPDAVASLAIAMLQLMRHHSARHDLQFALRIGMHCGPTIAGVIGQKRFLYDVWGDVVNIASRMESSGMAGKIHVSEDLYRALQVNFDFEERGITDIRGKGPMNTYFLVGAKAAIGHSKGCVIAFGPSFNSLWIHTMNRCSRTTAPSHSRRKAWQTLLATALLSFTTASFAQLNVRPFPPTAERGLMVVVAPPVIQMNGQPDRLSPGSRIHGLNNLLVLSGSVIGQNLLVNFVRDPLGLVHEVWVLTPEEASLILPTQR